MRRRKKALRIELIKLLVITLASFGVAWIAGEQGLGERDRAPQRHFADGGVFDQIYVAQVPK